MYTGMVDLKEVDALIQNLVTKYCEDDQEKLFEPETWDFSKISFCILKSMGKQFPQLFRLYLQMRDELTSQQEQRDLVVQQENAELVSCRKRIIELQDELIQCKNDQLQALQTTVKSSVEDSVKAKFKTYSAVVKKNLPPTNIAPETVKILVRSVVEEEDRSRSIMVFGLSEEAGEGEEQLVSKVEEVLLEIGEKPRVEAIRLGTSSNSASTRTRPVKVTVGSSLAVNQILAKAKRLGQSTKFSRVFISPDRSPAQRAEHRALVLALKDKRESDPSKRYYVRDGKFLCTEKLA